MPRPRRNAKREAAHRSRHRAPPPGGPASIPENRSGHTASASTVKKWLPVLVGLLILIYVGREAWQVRQAPPRVPDRKPNVTTAIPQGPLGHYNLGRKLQSEGRLSEATEHYRQAIALSDGDARFHNNLGAALAMQDKLDEAIEQFTEAVRLEPENVEAHFNLGNALFSHGQTASAIQQYRLAIKLSPEHAKAHNNLAVALKQAGQLQDAYRHRYEAMRLERAAQGVDTAGP